MRSARDQVMLMRRPGGKPRTRSAGEAWRRYGIRETHACWTEKSLVLIVRLSVNRTMRQAEKYPRSVQ